MEMAGGREKGRGGEWRKRGRNGTTLVNKVTVGIPSYITFYGMHAQCNNFAYYTLHIAHYTLYCACAVVDLCDDAIGWKS